MTQETINNCFESALGQQCNSLFSTSDDRVFINHFDALRHTKGQLDPKTKPLKDKTITEWFPE